MKPARRLILRVQSITLVLALLALAGFAAWATLTWQASADWTYAHRASLGTSSRELLAKLDQPVTITAFARRGTRIAEIERRLLERYTRVDPTIKLRFLNPDTALAQMRKLGITTVGELYVRYGAHGMKLDTISEAGITNALLRLARGADKRIAFITGHGEPSPEGRRNYDLGRFGAALKRQGFKVGTLNLADSKLDTGIALVVLAGPQLNLPAGEVTALVSWLKQGGNLLWLENPGPLHGLAPLANALGIKPLDGTIASTASRGFGIDNPTALIISAYGKSPITKDFSTNTLFPDATGFEIVQADTWHYTPFIQSRKFPTSWLMKGGPQNGRVLYRPAVDTPGPVPIAIAMTRNGGKQRAAVVGNVSFLANSYLANGGNLDLGLKLVNWLSHEDRFLDITPARAPDQSLTLSTAEQAGIAFGFLAFLPGLFLLLALVLVWLRRRH